MNTTQIKKESPLRYLPAAIAVFVVVGLLLMANLARRLMTPRRTRR